MLSYNEVLAKSRMETRPTSRRVSTTRPTRNQLDRLFDMRQQVAVNYEVLKYCLDVFSVLTYYDEGPSTG